MGEALPLGRWRPDNHQKLSRFLAAYEGTPAIGLFDADHTTWGGDVGDSTLVHLLRNLGLSPRLSAVLPEVVAVPGEGFGVPSPGRLFPRARVDAALAAMTAAYREAVSPSASVDELLGAFTEALVLPGGPLHGDTAFTAAYRIYTGTVLATYALLEDRVGCLAFDSGAARTVTDLFPPVVHDFYGSAPPVDLAPFARPGPDGQLDVIFPAVLDTGPDQRQLQAAGRLGAYSQVAVWEALDRTPAEMARLGLEVWEASAAERRFDVVFPVDAASASSPAPIDLAVDPSRLAPGASPAEGVVLGAASMVQGVRFREEIADLWAAMARRGMVPAVVTASHADLVRAVVDRHYGLSGFPVTGMLPAIEGGRYAATLTAPAPYRPGKVDAARALARAVTGDEEARPALCAGDTNTDLEMLAYGSDYRLFFDRGKRPFMDFAHHLSARGLGDRTLVEAPF
jgi:hypothetical protein